MIFGGLLIYLDYFLPSLLYRSAKLKKQDTLELTVANQVSNHCSDDLDLFLFGLDLGNLVPIFRNQEVSFAVLLNMSEADLEKVCIFFICFHC